MNSYKKPVDQDKGYSLGHVLTEARKYEGIAAGKQSLQSLKIPHHAVNEVKRRNVCIHCALSHPPRQCPAYKDHRKYCDGIVDGPAILGLRACEQMHIVTIDAIKSTANCPASVGEAQKPTVTSIADLKKQFPDKFDRIGSFEGKASLFLKRDAIPSIDLPRKCSIHLKARLQQELDTMENDGIIRKIEHHTDWCSSITTGVKKDGSLRFCLDPKRINDSLKRCPNKIPTLEELNPEFAEARVFSRMDAKAGYWSIHLDETSQEITTFRTPFGMYCYNRLPFGLCVSQDLFQQAMNRILARASACVGIADDVVVYGRDDAEHDKKLMRLVQVAK